MAVRTKQSGGKTIFVVASLDADWNYSTNFATHVNGLRVQSIQYVPSGKADVFVLKAGSATGPTICYCSSLNNFETKYFYGQSIKPFYDVSATGNYCVASANAKFIIALGGFLG